MVSLLKIGSMNKSNFKIVFFGTPDFAMPVLESLTQAGYNVSRFQSKSLKDDAIFDEFKKLNPDLCVIAAYGKILPSRYLDIPKYGFLNIHPSILPKYRGPSPIQTALLNGDKETGVSIMAIDEKVDHGPVLATRTYNIPDSKSNTEISKELFELGGQLLIEILPRYINEEISPKEQKHNQATFTKMFSRDDWHINWSESTEKIYNQIRALNPEPGTWTTWRDKVVNIKKAELVAGKINIKTIQMEGKKEMPFEEFLRGHSDFEISQLK